MHVIATCMWIALHVSLPQGRFLCVFEGVEASAIEHLLRLLNVLKVEDSVPILLATIASMWQHVKNIQTHSNTFKHIQQTFQTI
jgi:hypothetical protein